MLVRANSVNVDVRSGQRVQLVMRCAPGSELYVLSAHGICLSAEHHDPGAHKMHAVDAVASANVPAGQRSQEALRLRLANVPREHGSGAERPMPAKNPAGVAWHWIMLCKWV